MNTKKIYRSRDNKMIAGVCGGIAEYLSVDPTVVRILFVFLLFLGGNGLFLYLILMFLIPQRPVEISSVPEENQDLSKPGG
jgi:phage shock protein C